MPHYYDKEQSSELRVNEIKTRIRGNDLVFKTASGVFGKKKVDPGSLLLAEKCVVEGRVLDLGCGYGPVGISIAKAFPNDVVMTDVNRRAVLMARDNAKLNNVEVEVLQGDGYEKVKGKFGTILLNPPQSAGKDLCLRLIKDAREYLEKGGSIQIVVRHQKGGKDISSKMEEFYGNVEVVAKKSGYRVYLFRLE